MTSKAGKSKFDVLKNYFEPQKKVKPNSMPQNQLRVQDRELEAFSRSNQIIEEEGDEAPVVVDAEEGFKIGFDLKQNVNKPGPNKAFGNNKNVFKPAGKWVSVDQAPKPQQQPSVINAKRPLPSDSESSASSDEDEGRKRHDTDSEGDDSDMDEDSKVKKDILNAMGDPKDKKAIVQEDDDEDLDVVRKTDIEAPKKVGGLKTVAELKQESEQDVEKKKMMNALAEQFKDASTVHRGKDGRRVNIFKDIETKRKELQEKNEANIKKWSGGVVQKKKQDDMKAQMKTAAQDFGKTGISKEFDTSLMDKKRFGDIMAPEIEKNEKKDTEVVKKVRPMILCKFPGIPNRYGIEPGRMWDGVDRGSEYERRLAAKINERKDREDQAHTWAMQEM